MSIAGMSCWRHLVVLILLSSCAMGLARPALPNDRDFQALSISGIACFAEQGDLPIWDLYGDSPGVTQRLGVSSRYLLSCPLFFNPIERSSRHGDNDLSQLRLHYVDSDALGDNVFVRVQLWRARVAKDGTLERKLLCGWNSSKVGRPSSDYAVAASPCVQDIAGKSFHWFLVELKTTDNIRRFDFAGFVGVDFPGTDPELALASSGGLAAAKAARMGNKLGPVAGARLEQFLRKVNWKPVSRWRGKPPALIARLRDNRRPENRDGVGSR